MMPLRKPTLINPLTHDQRSEFSRLKRLASDRFLRIEDVMERTTLSKTGVYRLIWAGELTKIKLGRTTVFSEFEFNQWMESKKVGGVK